MTDLTNITLPDLSGEGALLHVSLSEGAAMIRIESDQIASCRVEIDDLAEALSLLANHDERAADRRRAEEAAEPERRRVLEAEVERQTLDAAQARIGALIDSLEGIDDAGDSRRLVDDKQEQAESFQQTDADAGVEEEGGASQTNGTENLDQGTEPSEESESDQLLEA